MDCFVENTRQNELSIVSWKDKSLFYILKCLIEFLPQTVSLILIGKLTAGCWTISNVRFDSRWCIKTAHNPVFWYTELICCNFWILFRLYCYLKLAFGSPCYFLWLNIASWVVAHWLPSGLDTWPLDKVNSTLVHLYSSFLS